jgi:hypothetical protein
LALVILFLLSLASVYVQCSQHRSQMIEEVLLKRFLSVRRFLLSENDDRGVGTNPDRQRKLQHLLAFGIDLCEAMGIKCWLHGGTLLGAWRAQRIDPWDHDVDFGMTESDADKFREQITNGTVKAFTRTHPQYATMYVDVNNEPDACSPFHLRDRTHMEFWASLFEFKVIRMPACRLQHVWTVHTANCHGCNSRILVDNRRLMELPCEWVVPGTYCNISNHWAVCPRETKQYLEYYYGSDLSVPTKWQKADEEFGR